jgi:hypothetical protein
MPSYSPERRKSPRFPAAGRVDVIFANPDLAVLGAELQEDGAQGCRILHDSPDLLAGTEVQIRHGGSIRRARVVWTHLLDGRRLSGCVML